MPEQLGLNSDLNVGTKRLHIQTSFSNTSSSIIANIFDSGRVVEAQEVRVGSDEINGGLKEKIKQIHQSVVSDIELLFFISEKVRQVKHPASCNKLGLVFLKRGFIDEATSFFTLAIGADDKLVEAYNNLGLCFEKKKDYDRAEEIYRKGLQINDTFADLNLNLGRVYLEKEKYVDAINAIDRALQVNSAYFEAHYYMGLALLISLVKKIEGAALPAPAARGQKAMEHFQRAGELFKPFFNEAYQQGETAMKADDPEIALKCFQRAYQESIKKMDLTFDHEFYLKFMYGGKGKDNQYIGLYVEQLKSAIDAFPEYADLHNNLGIAYLIMCRNLFLKALEEFRKALKINPSFKNAAKNLKLAENDGKGFLILLRAILK